MKFVRVLFLVGPLLICQQGFASRKYSQRQLQDDPIRRADRPPLCGLPRMRMQVQKPGAMMKPGKDLRKLNRREIQAKAVSLRIDARWERHLVDMVARRERYVADLNASDDQDDAGLKALRERYLADMNALRELFHTDMKALYKRLHAAM